MVRHPAAAAAAGAAHCIPLLRPLVPPSLQGGRLSSPFVLRAAEAKLVERVVKVGEVAGSEREVVAGDEEEGRGVACG